MAGTEPIGSVPAILIGPLVEFAFGLSNAYWVPDAGPI